MPEPDPKASGKLTFLFRRWFKTTKVEQMPADVETLFNEYSEVHRHIKIIPRIKLQKFLVDKQGMEDNNVEDHARVIIASRNLKGIKNYSRHGLSSNGFLQYLLNSEQNPPLAKKKLNEDGVLARYFVYTSNRSYKKQEKVCQHQSNTSDEEKTIVYNSITAIGKALKNGVKVIELDLFPSSHKPDFYVGHPGSLGSHLTLKRCLEVINEKAFCTSRFPLIIILVVNFDSSLPPREVSNLLKELNKRIQKAFGESKLCSPDEDFTKLSLKSLKDKIIVLTRQREPTSTDKNELAEEEKYIAGYVKELDGEFENHPKTEHGKPWILRLTENNVENSKTQDMISFTQENLLAVKSSTASNYDPLISWTRGAQMVAFNMQDRDKYLYIMQGLFRAQGDGNTGKPTGFVEKPSVLLNRTFDPTSWRPVRKILKVKVYLGTGWHLDFDSKEFDKTSHPDFFTTVGIVGVPEDEAQEKTIPASDQVIPFWDKEFEFPLTVPELAMLMIEVREFDTDRTHDFAGQNCLPVCQLRNGIRSVPLYDKKGKPYRAARLLMRFQLE